MTALAHSALFVAAVLALAAGASRVAALAAPAGLERALAAAVLAATAAIIEALGLGLAGLGGDATALAAAAVLTWAAVRRWAPAPADGGLTAQALAGLAAAPAAVRALLGAVAGLILALLAFDLQHPLVGLDGVAYHLPEIVFWIQGGHPGAIVASIPGVPTGSYPLTNEVLLAWGMGLSSSFAPVAAWTATALSLLLAAGWLGLRRLGVSASASALALAAVVAAPDFAAELNTPMNDGITLMWLVVAAALTVAAVRDRPRLYAVAVLAGALSIGTKTTAAPLVALVLVAGGLRMRRWSRPALILAAAAGLLAGGTWYVRNLIQHGSPFWPLLPGPFGDPVPASLVPADVRFIARPLATLDGRLDDYARLMAGNLVLLFGGIAAAALAPRTRRVAAASAVTAVSVLLWTDAPFTGRGHDAAGDLSLAVTRYLLPGVACGATALALAARRRTVGGRLALAALAGALLWSLRQSAQFDFPTLPSAARLVAGAVLGGAALAGGAVFLRPRRALVLVAAAGIVLAGGLAAAAPGYVARNAQTDTTFAAPLLRWFSAQPAFATGRDPIATTAPRIGLLAGDGLHHRLDLVGAQEPCPAVRARARRGWVVVLDFAPFLIKFFPRGTAGACLADQRPLFVDGGFRVYRTG